MKDKLVIFETAELAKKKEFKVPTWDYFCPQGEQCNPKRQDWNSLNAPYEHTSRPTQSLLQRWLREVHKINVESNYLPNIQKYSCLYIPMTGKASIKDINYVSKIRFNTYEEALELGLQEALKLIKDATK